MLNKNTVKDQILSIQADNSDETLVEEAQKYTLESDDDFKISYNTVYKKCSGLLKDIVAKMHSDKNEDALNNIYSKRFNIIHKAIEEYTSGSNPYTTLQNAMEQDVKDRLRDVLASKPKSRDIDNIEDVPGHPEKLLPLILQAQKEYFSGQNGDAVAELFKKSLPFIHSFVKRYRSRGHSPWIGNKETDPHVQLEGVDSYDDVTGEAINPFFLTLERYVPYKDDQVMNWGTFLLTNVKQYFMNKHSNTKRLMSAPHAENYALKENQEEEITRGSGDTDHVSKYKKKGSNKELPKKIINIRAISDGEEAFTEGTDFEISDTDGIKWLSGGKSPKAGSKYKVSFDYSEEVAVIIPQTSMSTPLGESGEEPEGDSETMGETIVDLLTSNPEYQYEEKHLDKLIDDKIRDLSGGGAEGEKFVSIYHQLKDNRFDTETKNKIKRDYHVRDSALTTWLRWKIYPAIFEVMKKRSRSKAPGSGIDNEELDILLNRKRHTAPTEVASPKSEKEEVKEEDLEEAVDEEALE